MVLALIDEPFIMVERTEESARKTRQDVLFYRKLLRTLPGELFLLPPPEGPQASGKRAEVVHGGFSGKTASSVVTSLDAMESPVWKPEDLRDSALDLAVGGSLERDSIGEAIERLGYVRVPIVAEKGQYSLRGWILDVFPASEEQPMRVEFFGDEIESIRLFEVETQRSVSSVKGFELLPAMEPRTGVPFMELAAGMRFFYSEEAGLQMPEGAVALSRFSIAGEGLDAGLMPIGGLGLRPEERKGIYELTQAVKAAAAGEDRVMVVASSAKQAERLRDIFRDADMVCPILDIEGLFEYEGRFFITVGELSEGVYLPGLLILTEEEIFGGRPAYRPIKKSKASKLLSTIDDFFVGDYVVHRDHGIGRFAGIQRQDVGGSEYELMAVEFAGGDRLYIPLYSMDRIKKYRAEEGVRPDVDRLGSRSWQRTKEKVWKRVREMAEKLLRHYAEREVSEGFSFSPDTELHREFDSFFPYEETPDQLKAIAEIKADMESQRPMDRLLCGDVGYGKTEVAMRAAFKAVYDGKQVVVLVPTTLLCEQHLRIFRKRFSAFPVKVDYLSRFKPKKERIETIKKLKAGEIDIVIATHALLKADVSFCSLGLLIIDEEHRFGVGQKERLKELKKGVDVLALSATPIPRTLQMALSGIRRMSLIETPPEDRFTVKGVVAVFDEALIREAINKELEREGQVFFVHNRILDISKVEELLVRIVPGARLAVAHGRTPEAQLEKTMISFLDGDIDVLLSTAIIGSGLDIPTANTIIIDMAHRMGLADLYQLKGRVGRSSVKAFAYYLVPGGDEMTDEAKKRLQAIQELNYMGAGVRLAMMDLEIRGAGNLLGHQQSGYIHAVGFDLYIEMLEQAVAELRGEPVKEAIKTSINVKLDAFIPEDYIEDASVRLGVYRAAASADTEKDIEDILSGMVDRFGEPPAAFRNLLRVVSLRLIAGRMRITDIRQTDGWVRLIFAKEASVSADGILNLLKGKVRFHPDGFEFPAGADACESAGSVIETLGRTGRP